MPINWELGRMPNVGGNALAAFQQGEKMGETIRRRRAIKAFTENPDDPEALSSLMEADPELGFRASEYQRKRRAALKDDQYSDAAVEYLGPNGDGTEAASPRSTTRRNLLAAPGGTASAPPNALAAFTGQQGHWPAPGEGSQSPQRPGALSAYTQPQGSWPSPDEAPSLPDSRQEPDPELAFLGTPQTPRDRAFLKMVRIDPVKALKLRSTLRDNFVQGLKDTQTLYEVGIARLANVNDEQGYQAVLAELEPMSEAIGGNLLDHVPANYPGPEGIQALRMKALNAKDQVTAFMQQANIEADNERADRNTDSLIGDRAARRGETRRNNDQRDRTTRRGQDTRGRGASRSPVRVKSIEEARALKPGTVFRTPDGRVKVR